MTRQSLLAFGLALSVSCGGNGPAPSAQMPVAQGYVPAPSPPSPPPFSSITLTPPAGSVVRTRTDCAEGRVCTEPVAFRFTVVSRFDMPDAEVQVLLGTPDRWCAVGSLRTSLVAEQPADFFIEVLYLSDATNKQVVGEPCPLPVTTSRIEWRASSQNAGINQASFPGPTYTFTQP